MPDTAFDDSDSIITRPMSKLAVLRADALACRLLLDTIDDSLSPEWHEAHLQLVAANARAKAEESHGRSSIEAALLTLEYR